MRTQVGFRHQQQRGVPKGCTEEEISLDEDNLPQEKIYVAVGKDMAESVNALKWALQNLSNSEETLIIILHVRLPLRCIPTPIGRIPVKQANEDVVKAFLTIKMKELNIRMQKYFDICTEAHVKAEIMFIEKDDVAKGIVEVISEKGVQKLIVGTTSAGGSIFRKVRMRSSGGIGDYVQKHAVESCEVSIVCKDKLVLRRQGSPVNYVAQSYKTFQIHHSTSTGSEEEFDSQRTITIDRDSSYSESAHSAEFYFDGVHACHTVQPQPQGEYQDVLDIGTLEEQFTQRLKVAENAKLLGAESAAVVNSNYGIKELLETLPSTSSSSHHLEFREYTFDEIKEATSNFSEHFRLGEGGYGIVYKGQIRQTSVAIKILRENSSQGRKEFEREVDILRAVGHPHLVRLVGFCFEQCCLIYEYMSNGSLEEYLSSSKGRRRLPWQARIRIAVEICSALQYLHSIKPHPVVHRDVKPANILLDDDYTSKIGDFGLARPLPLLVDSNSKSELKGTFGYMDPECLTSVQCSTKSDVYSIGIVILQLLTGKAAAEVVNEVKRSLKCKHLEQVLDPSAGEWPFAEASQLAYLALQFTNPVRKKRPQLVHPKVMEVLNQIRKITVPASNSCRPVEDGQN